MRHPTSFSELRRGHPPLTRALAFSRASRYYLDMLRFAWDERKNRGNRIKHGIWFEEARSVFDDPRARLFHDPEHSEGEDRFILLGVSSAARTLVGINLSPEVLDYFKGLADQTGLPYQKLIDLYLLDCARKRKKLAMKWLA